MKEKMIPRQDGIFVKPFVEEFDGKLLFPDKHKQRLTYGTVVAVGPNVKPDIKVGCRVYYSNWAGVMFNKENIREIIQLHDADVTSISNDELGIEVEVGTIGFCREK